MSKTIQELRDAAAYLSKLAQLEMEIYDLTDRVDALETPGPPRVAREPDEWQHLLDTIGDDCRQHGWTDSDAWIAWQMGRSAMLQARLHQARFGHDAEGRS